MMSPNHIPENRSPSRPATFRQTPLKVIHVFGNFMRIWSIYSVYRYLSQTGASVVLFIFSCLVPSSILFLLMQKPWKGRPLSNTQVVPSVINGGITALYFILWGKGLRSCGPLRIILAEYSGAVLGVLSAVLYGRRDRVWRKVGGLLAMLASFYFLSQGWASASQSPLSFSDNEDADVQPEEVLGVKQMLIPIFAGILSALRRVIARRVSLKNQLKRRLNAVTIASATCFLFPVAMWDMIIGSTNVELPFSMWAFSSFVVFGIILIFYVDSIAEERLNMVFSSPRHLLVAGGCIIVMDIVYKMDFSLPGFLLCAAILGFGIHEATSLDRMRKDSLQSSVISDEAYEDQIHMSPLPT
ncbi:zinc transporter 5 [Salvia hispanica]|uniref:zinc transporter 5 n=1 Tax=Salvia hispanica TaxID=49212 RepID=UPI002009A832|nr:zinc transporter 5 [Salvia hispanica]